MGLCTEGDKMTRAKTETVRLPQSCLLHEYVNPRLPKYMLEEAEGQLCSLINKGQWCFKAALSLWEDPR